jgi:trans-aconitate methyltransferase
LHARSIPLVLIIRLPASSFTADNGESLIVIFLSARHESHGTTYLETIRTEVLAYDELQDAVADATAGIQAERVLELGVGTGETSRRALDRHPEAELVGIDESADMLAAASLDVAADLRVSRIEDELPEGNFDLVVSALAVHHLGRCR